MPLNIRGFRIIGTSGRSRTATPVKEPDFESGVSTNFTTLALKLVQRPRIILFLKYLSTTCLKKALIIIILPDFMS